MKIEWKSCFRVGITAFLLFLGIYYWSSVASGLALLLSAASPLITGAVIAYLLNILMSFYERHYFPNSRAAAVEKSRRMVCLTAAIVTFLGIVAAVIGLVIPEVAASVQLSVQLLIDWLPGAVEKLSENTSLAEVIPGEYLESLKSADWQSLLSKVVQFLFNGISGAVGTVAGAISSVFSRVVAFACGVIFALYLLLGRDRLGGQCRRLMGNYLPERVREKLLYILSVLNDCFHRYVVGQCTEAVILGCLCMAGMFVFRLPYATMIGALVGFSALIPIAGAYIGAIVGAFMILTVSPLKAVLFVVFLTILQQLENNLIYPKVVGSSIGLPGIWVLAAVTIGGSLFGVPGMMLGVPVAAAIYRLIREDMRRREENKHEEKKHEAAPCGTGRAYPERGPKRQTEKALSYEKEKKAEPGQNREPSQKAVTAEKKADGQKPENARRPENGQKPENARRPENGQKPENGQRPKRKPEKRTAQTPGK